MPISRRPNRLRLRALAFRVGLALSAVLFLSAGSLAGWRWITHNAEAVEPGKFYRSGQLTASELREAIAHDHLRSVINLRGENKRDAWYRDEVAVCRELNVRHYDVRIASGRLPKPQEAALLLSALRDAPQPILIHCCSGSNRSGFAACLFLIDVEKVPWRKAESEMDWTHGHFAFYPYFELNEFVQLYGQSADPSILDWTRRTYPSVYADEMHESKWDEMTEPLELLVRGRLD